METRIVEWFATDGTRLAATLRGPVEGATLPVLLLPGLTRNGRDFARLAEALSGDPDRPRLTVAMDFRGRGLSGRADPATYRPDVEAQDVLAGLDRLGIGQAAIVGTSRGGIVAMILAATAGGRVGPVVLNDIGPVIELTGLVAIRDRMGTMLGDPPADWASAVADLKAVMAARFTAMSDDDWRAFAYQMYREDEAGRPVLDYDPALLRAFAGFDPKTGLAPLWPVFEALGQRPVLAVRGENSDLLSEATLTEMQVRLPQLQIHRVPDEGHAPLLRDRPTIRRIAGFLGAA